MQNLTALDRLLTGAGFSLVRHKNHKIWRCPAGTPGSRCPAPATGAGATRTRKR